MTDTEPTLRDRLTSALDQAARTNPCGCGSTIWSSCAPHEGRPTHSERRADAVLAVVQPELDRLAAEAASLRTVARAAAVLLHDTADRASSGIAIHAGVLRGAAKAIDDITTKET